MSDQPGFFDPIALGLEASGQFVEPASTPMRARKALTPEDKAARKAAKVKKPAPDPHAVRAALIPDFEAREAEGRRIHAELGAEIEALIAERKALLARPAYDSETLGADLDWERFRNGRRELGRDGPYVRQCNRVFTDASADYMAENSACARRSRRAGASKSKFQTPTPIRTCSPAISRCRPGSNGKTAMPSGEIAPNRGRSFSNGSRKAPARSRSR